MSTAAKPILELAGVHTHIGAYHILHGVDLEVPRGQLTMLLGRNGAGKTTTLRTIMGLWRASQGRITFDGQDITQAATPQIAGRHGEVDAVQDVVRADVRVHAGELEDRLGSGAHAGAASGASPR